MSIKVISNWYAAQYMLLCSVFKENIRRMDVCVADHSLTEFLHCPFEQRGLLGSQRHVEYVYAVELC